jgi:hypothetical protein
MAVAVSTALLFGTVPAVRAGRADPLDALNRNRRGLLGGGPGRMGDALVIAQIALSLVLVIGAALFGRSFAALVYRDLGFDRGRVLTAVVDVRQSPTAPADRPELYERIRQAVATVPAWRAPRFRWRPRSAALGCGSCAMSRNLAIQRSRGKRFLS